MARSWNHETQQLHIILFRDNEFVNNQILDSILKLDPIIESLCNLRQNVLQYFQPIGISTEGKKG